MYGTGPLHSSAQRKAMMSVMAIWTTPLVRRTLSRVRGAAVCGMMQELDCR
jgi:hypothetical protein